MSIKSKVLATAATLALVGGVGTAGVLGTAVTANAATPSCGNTCVDIFSQEFGHHSVPNFLLDVYQQHIRIGQPVILFRSSNNDRPRTSAWSSRAPWPTSTWPAWSAPPGAALRLRAE